MSTSQKRRYRRRRKVVRQFKKTFINIVFAPMRIPKIKRDTAEFLMKLCEIAALSFVCMLVGHMAMPETVRVAAVVVTGVAFGVLLALIKLSDYQEKIERYRYYGFRI